MKNYLQTAFILFVTFLSACSKSGSMSIEGKWNVLSDSTITSGGAISYSVYIGGNGDYFVFKNGILYSKEPSQLDTFSYKIPSANAISLIETGTSFNAISGSGAYVFNGDNIRINISPDFTNPGFTYRRIINLKR